LSKIRPGDRPGSAVGAALRRREPGV